MFTWFLQIITCGVYSYSQGESKLAHAHGAKRRGLGGEWRAGLAGGTKVPRLQLRIT